MSETVPGPIAVVGALDERVRFLTELARRLHHAGVSAQRLEGAVRATALALHVSAEIWSTPTGLLLSLSDADVPHGPQQTRVLGMLGEGLLNKQIAYELNVSEATIKAHVSAILQKLGVDSRTQAVIQLSKIGSEPLQTAG